MLSFHRHQTSDTGLRITTHTAGTNFGTFARVALADNPEVTVYESPTFGLGAHEAATRAARRWIDRQAYIGPPKTL